MKHQPITATERAQAIARLNARQQERNCYTNIGEKEVRREVYKERNNAVIINARTLATKVIPESQVNDYLMTHRDWWLAGAEMARLALETGVIDSTL